MKSSHGKVLHVQLHPRHAGAGVAQELVVAETSRLALAPHLRIALHQLGVARRQHQASTLVFDAALDRHPVRAALGAPVEVLAHKTPPLVALGLELQQLVGTHLAPLNARHTRDRAGSSDNFLERAAELGVGVLPAQTSSATEEGDLVEEALKAFDASQRVPVVLPEGGAVRVHRCAQAVAAQGHGHACPKFSNVSALAYLLYEATIRSTFENVFADELARQGVHRHLSAR